MNDQNDRGKCDLCGRQASENNPLAPFIIESRYGIFEQLICSKCRERKSKHPTWRDPSISDID
jgi:hypothetical protein